uniref:Uncharacterized protein n=1 Tax=Megaviridae environmental sample TaxID=1737588 RepID=A0A5J6VIF8_9VIRU|nr:MAG: hypothetical protein [Megaviridae environmental sample]
MSTFTSADGQNYIYASYPFNRGTTPSSEYEIKNYGRAQRIECHRETMRKRAIAEKASIKSRRVARQRARESRRKAHHQQHEIRMKEITQNIFKQTQVFKDTISAMQN